MTSGAVVLLVIIAAVGGRIGGMQGFVLIAVAVVGSAWAAGAPIERLVRILLTGN